MTTKFLNERPINTLNRPLVSKTSEKDCQVTDIILNVIIANILETAL